MQKLAVLGFMPPVQSIADPTPRFTVDSARYLQVFLQFCIDRIMICVNPPKERQSLLTKFYFAFSIIVNTDDQLYQ